MPTAQYRKFKAYAGFVVRGNTPVAMPDASRPHISRAFYVLAQLEAANWGTVQSYDGCGISAGPLHAIAVSPSTKKPGSLWPLLSTLFEHSPPTLSPQVDALRTLLADAGAVVTPQGVLVERKSGRPFRGDEIHSLLSTPRGVVPSAGPVFEQAMKVALTFHRAFSSPTTFAAQEAYTVKWLLDGNRKGEFETYSRYARTSVTASRMPYFLSYATGEEDIGPHLDIAMCAYHAFSVNGPTPAARALSAAMGKSTRVETFAKTLIRGLGTSTYGRWKDNDENTSRYDKTRRVIEKMPFWDKKLVRELLPENL